jgi:hypothetical protein
MHLNQQRQRCSRVLLIPVAVAAFVFGQFARFLPAPGQLSGSASSSTTSEFIAQRGKACFVILMHKKAP